MIRYVWDNWSKYLPNLLSQLSLCLWFLDHKQHSFKHKYVRNKESNAANHCSADNLMLLNVTDTDYIRLLNFTLLSGSGLH